MATNIFRTFWQKIMMTFCFVLNSNMLKLYQNFCRKWAGKLLHRAFLYVSFRYIIKLFLGLWLRERWNCHEENWQIINLRNVLERKPWILRMNFQGQRLSALVAARQIFLEMLFNRKTVAHLLAFQWKIKISAFLFCETTYANTKEDDRRDNSQLASIFSRSLS